MNKTRFGEVMKKASSALLFDSQDKPEEAFREYVSCLNIISSDLGQLVNASPGISANLLAINKETRQAIHVGQQCMDRIAAILHDLDSEPLSKSGSASSEVTDNNLSHLNQPGTLGYKTHPLPESTSQISSVPDSVCESIPHKPVPVPGKSPLEIAHRHNKQLIHSFRERAAQLPYSMTANLNLTLQRKMAENLAIARAREQSIIKKIRERQMILENEASRRLNVVLGETQDDHVYRQVYKNILQYEQNAEWLASWRDKLRASPQDANIIRDLIAEILKSSDHPLTQLLKSYQYQVYERIYPLVAHNLQELDKISVPLNDVYWLTALDVCARTICKRIKGKTRDRNEINENRDADLIECSDNSPKSSDDILSEHEKVHAEDQQSITNTSFICTENLSIGENFDHAGTREGKGFYDIKVTSDLTPNGENKKGDNRINITSENNDTEGRHIDNDENCNDVVRAGGKRESVEDVDDFERGKDEVVSRSQEGTSDENVARKHRLSLEFLLNKQQDRTIKDIRKTTEEIYDEIMSANDPLPDFSQSSGQFANRGESTSDAETSDGGKPGMSNEAIRFDDVKEDDFVKMKNDAYAIHLDSLKRDVHRYMERLQVLFIITFEEMDSAEGRDLCYAYLEVAFFSPLWSYILALFRLANMQKELCLAVAMSELINATPQDLCVKDKLVLSDSSSAETSPYSAAVDQLNAISKWFTPLSKLECLVSVTESIVHSIDDHFSRDPNGKKPEIGADDLVPIMSYVIIRSGLPSILSECHILEEFVHEGYLMGKEGYCLTSLQTATSYVVSLGEQILHKRMSRDT